MASKMKTGDHIWALPDNPGTPPDIPTGLLFKLAGIIHDGGQVGLAERSGVEGAKIRNMLLLLLSPPERHA